MGFARLGLPGEREYLRGNGKNARPEAPWRV